MTNQKQIWINIETSVLLFSIIFLISLTLWHTTKSIQKLRSPNSNIKFTFQSVLFYSFIVLFFGMSFVTLGIFNVIYWHFLHLMTPLYCHLFSYLLAILYACFKGVSFLAYVMRLKSSFAGNFEIYPKIFYLIWATIITLFTLISLLLCMIGIKLIPKGNECISIFPDYLILFLLFGDFIICAVNLYLFIHPIYAVSKRNTNKIMSKRLMHTMKKNAILATCAMISTIIMWIIMGIFHGEWTFIYQSVDVIITTVSIVLLFEWNSKIYNIVCCCWSHVRHKTGIKSMHSESSMVKSKSETSKTPKSDSEMATPTDIDITVKSDTEMTSPVSPQ